MTRIHADKRQVRLIFYPRPSASSAGFIIQSNRSRHTLCAVVSTMTKNTNLMPQSGLTAHGVCLLLLIASCGDLVATARADDFDTVVAPLVARQCLGCHNATD